MSIVLTEQVSSQNPNGLWDIAVNLQDGTYNAKLNGVDLNGNPVSKTITFTVGVLASSGNIGGQSQGVGTNNPLPTSSYEFNFISIGIVLMLFSLILQKYWLKLTNKKKFEESLSEE